MFVPIFLQPADPVSTLQASCGRCRARALRAAHDIWQRLGDNLSYALYIGSAARYVGDALGPVVALPSELEGGDEEGAGLFGSSWVSGCVERVGGIYSNPWGPRENGCGCQSDPRTRVEDVRRRGSTLVIVGIGGWTARTQSGNIVIGPRAVRGTEGHRPGAEVPWRRTK